MKQIRILVVLVAGLILAAFFIESMVIVILVTALVLLLFILGLTFFPVNKERVTDEPGAVKDSAVDRQEDGSFVGHEPSAGQDLAERLRDIEGEYLELKRGLVDLGNNTLPQSLAFLICATAIAREVPGETEAAAFTVMEQFLQIQDSSAKAAEAARSLVEGLGAAGGNQSLTATALRTKKALEGEQQAICDLEACIRENRKQLSAMHRDLANGQQMLEQINEITERSKLIAFNMAIEAARIGEKARGFKVIVGEIHRLNERTFEFSHQISELLARFSGYNDNMISMMEEKGSAVIARVSEGINSADEAVTSLLRASDQTENFSSDIAERSQGIARDLDKVLESLQFQDITRQMIEGALDILNQLKTGIEDAASRLGTPVSDSRLGPMLDEYRKQFIAVAKTNGEKKALQGVQP